jgi:hypothetical protein
MEHNQISRMCRQELVKLLNLANEKLIPQQPWDDYVFEYASTYHNDRTISQKELRENFRILVENVIAGNPNPRPRDYSTALQRHHDFFVKKFAKQGYLNDSDREQYKRAMAREYEGLVRPI